MCVPVISAVYLERAPISLFIFTGLTKQAKSSTGTILDVTTVSGHDQSGCVCPRTSNLHPVRVH
jgi:hypothetical protein